MAERKGSRAHAVRSKELRVAHKEVTTTTYREVGPGGETTKQVLKVEKVTYENLEDEQLKKKAKGLVVQQYQGSIPRELRDHAVTFVSQIYEDADWLWNPDGRGTFDAQRVVFVSEVGESVKTVGKTLKEGLKNINPILRLVNDTFVTSEGRNNENFQLFLKRCIVNRMRMEEDELDKYGASDWFGKKN